MITISNNKRAITINYQNGERCFAVQKNDCGIMLEGGLVQVYDSGKKDRVHNLDYNDISSPSVSSPKELFDLLELYVNGDTVWNKFGYNADLDTGGQEIIAEWGGSFDPKTDIMTAADTFTITYSTGVDGSGTTGATSLLFTYVDANNESNTGIHTLGSSGSDVTTFTGVGINRVVVLSNGGLGWNASKITIKATTDDTIQATIPALGSVTQQCIFHTDIGSSFDANWLTFNALKDSGGGSSPRVTFYGYSFSKVTQTRYEILRHTIDTSDQSYVSFSPGQDFSIGGREVLYFTAETTANNVLVNCRFSGVKRKT